MKTSPLIALLLLALAIYTNASCKNLETVNLDAAKYMGRWYEIAVSPWPRRTFQRNCACTSPKYTLNSTSVIVDNTCNDKTPDGKLSRSVGTAIIRDPSQPGKLSVTFGPGPYAPYWVMDTDYTGHAIIYSCSTVVGIKFESLWIISRRPTMDPQVYREIAEVAQKLTGFDVSTLAPTLQAGCRYPDSIEHIVNK